MNMFFSARRKDAAEYDGISQCSLKAAYDSTENCPKKIDITLTAEADFCGIIKIAFSDETGEDGNARFFMPGFMYGTNRGESPLVVDSKAPRLRMKEEFPASPWWMSERFCHSEGLLTESYPDGSPASTWFALMPWACGSILEGLTGDIYDENTGGLHDNGVF